MHCLHPALKNVLEEQEMTIFSAARKFDHHRAAQITCVLLCTIALKRYYSTATADQLRWILAPIAMLVEQVRGTSFEFETGAGYLNKQHFFLIAPSCSGINFLVTSFLMLSLRSISGSLSMKIRWLSIPAAAAIAYIVTIAANSMRIAIAMELQQAEVTFAGLDPPRIHRLEGILIYFGFLLLLFMISERFVQQNKVSASPKVTNALHRIWIPLVFYYVIAVCVPLANSGMRQGIRFWEHSLSVVIVTSGMILTLTVARYLGDFSRKRSKSGA
jgi:exosortase K